MMGHHNNRCISYRRLIAIQLVCFVAFSAGCGPKTTTGGSDPNKVMRLVGLLADCGANPQMAAPVFAEGCAPDIEKCRQFKLYNLQSREAEVVGDTATLFVDVKNSRTGQALPELTWTAVKENGEWKLKDTPLP